MSHIIVGPPHVSFLFLKLVHTVETTVVVGRWVEYTNVKLHLNKLLENCDLLYENLSNDVTPNAVHHLLHIEIEPLDDHWEG